jgi:hypothetical protein
MGNLDFTDQAGFSWYCLLLLFSGVALLALFLLPGLTRGGRVLNLLFGIGFLGYAIYLIFLFHGGTYVIFFKAFIVPVVLVINSLRGMRSANLRRRAGGARTARPAAGAANIAAQDAPAEPRL